MKCNFLLWPGEGYCLAGPFTVESELLHHDDLEHACELLAAKLIENNETDYYLTEEEYCNFCEEIGHNLEEIQDDLEGWLYVDGTMEGAPFPVYLRTENMRCEFAA